MSVRIAISDPLPIFRRGMMVILDDAGFNSEAPDDLMAWIRDEQQRVILMTLHSADDWALLARLHRASPELLVIAILEEATSAAYLRALAAGAVGVVSRSAPPETVRQVLEAVVRGTSVLPIEVLRALLPRAELPVLGEDVPSSREIGWLEQLAHGATVRQLADQVGYSERAMFRLLRDLYAKLHVRNRTEALMCARERGWLLLRSWSGCRTRRIYKAFYDDHRAAPARAGAPPVIMSPAVRFLDSQLELGKGFRSSRSETRCQDSRWTTARTRTPGKAVGRCVLARRRAARLCRAGRRSAEEAGVRCFCDADDPAWARGCRGRMSLLPNRAGRRWSTLHNNEIVRLPTWRTVPARETLIFRSLSKPAAPTARLCSSATPTTTRLSFIRSCCGFALSAYESGTTRASTRAVNGRMLSLMRLTAAACVVMITPNAVVSRNVRNEINAALKWGKPMLAVHLTQTELPKGLELQIGAAQAVMRWRMDEGPYARMLGWRRAFFLDDDIRDITYPDLQITVNMPRSFSAVGPRVKDFPDNSIVCHANRMTGGPQDVFVSGAALAVDCAAEIGFFPDLFHEDWLFFFDYASEGQLANSGLEATQLRYDPFASARLAGWQRTRFPGQTSAPDRRTADKGLRRRRLQGRSASSRAQVSWKRSRCASDKPSDNAISQ